MKRVDHQTSWGDRVAEETPGQYATPPVDKDMARVILGALDVACWEDMTGISRTGEDDPEYLRAKWRVIAMIQTMYPDVYAEFEQQLTQHRRVPQ